MDRSGDNRVRVGVADMAVTDNGATLLTSGLGSCVAVAIHDGSGNGGLLHAMLPEAPPDAVTEAKYVDSGVIAMKRELEDRGAETDSLRAKLTGGSSMLDLGNSVPVGDRNVTAAKRVLADADIRIEGRETGGGSGRSVVFEPTSGIMQIQRVDGDDINI